MEVERRRRSYLDEVQRKSNQNMILQNIKKSFKCGGE